jgi:CheY-like chemotaxis protein
MENAKVLVVEDDERERRLLCDFLRTRRNVEVHTARDGVEALHQISRSCYDVILLDVMMPKMSGVDFLDSLRALTLDSSVKAVEKTPAIIIITSASDAALPNEAIEHRYPGVVRGIFRKPLDTERLGACLDQQLP